MYKLANLFLICFTLLAASTLSMGLSPSLQSSDFLAQSRSLLLPLSQGLAVILYIASGFNQHLPKKLLYPLFLWLLWLQLECWPLANLTGEFYLICVGLLQLLLVFFLLLLNNRTNEAGLLLVPAQFTGPFFSGRNLLFFCLANIIVAPLLLFVLAFAGISQLVTSNTAGFVHLKPDGLYMTERTYVRQDKQIRLIAMIHLAGDNYYQNIVDSLPQTGTLILAEGVSDHQQLLSEHFHYGKIADFLGLTSQEQLHLPGRLISAEQLKQQAPESEPGLDILPADIDLSSFDPRTIKVLNAMAKYMLNAQSPLKGYLAFNQWAAENVESDIDRIVMADLLDKRNRSVLGYVQQALNSYHTLVIPWGALHMKGISKNLEEQGFTMQRSSEHRSINFAELPYKEIWQGLNKAEKL